MNIRNAVRSDLEAIVAIYNAAIPDRLATADLAPVTVASRLVWFEQRDRHRPVWVFEQEGAIAGWLSFQSFYGRPAYRATAELSLYVSPDFRRQGVGKSLLKTAIERAPQLELKTLLAFIFARNQPSLRLFYSCEFQQWGLFPCVADLDDTECDLAVLGRKV